MKIKLLLGLTVLISLFSCKENYVEVETSTEVLQTFPNGIMNFNIDDQNMVVENAHARKTNKETIISTSFSDLDTGDTKQIIIGIKGYAKGVFKGNIIGSYISSTELNKADIEITHYGEIGESIIGTYSLQEDGQSKQEISGDFVALRIY